MSAKELLLLIWSNASSKRWYLVTVKSSQMVGTTTKETVCYWHPCKLFNTSIGYMALVVGYTRDGRGVVTSLTEPLLPAPYIRSLSVVVLVVTQFTVREDWLELLG